MGKGKGEEGARRCIELIPDEGLEFDFPTGPRKRGNKPAGKQAQARKHRPAAGGSEEPDWVEEAVRLYPILNSLSEVARRVGKHKETVRRQLHKRGVQLSAPAPERPIRGQLGLRLEGGLAELRKELAKRVRDSDGQRVPEDILGYVINEEIFQESPSFEVYSRDPVLTHPRFVRNFGLGLMRVQAATGKKVTKELFEHVLCDALNAAEYQAELKQNTSWAGRDLQYLEGGEWKGISCKSEATVDTQEGNSTGNIRHLMTVRADDSAASIRKRLKDHLADYDRMLYLRSFDTRYRDVDQPAVRYDLYEVPMELLNSLTRTRSLARGANHIRTRINGQRIQFTCTWTPKELRLFAIPLAGLERHASFWVPAVQQRNRRA